MNYPKFSVLMSLYIKEKAVYFNECMQSLLRQTVLPSEIVIVLDGPIGNDLYKIINFYKDKYPNLIKLIIFENNQGLGLALAAGVPKCKYDLIARMDTDDIAREDRFEKQLKLFIDNPDLDICGSHIMEFDGDVKNIVSKRIVPIEHSDIAEYQKQRSAFNHMTVMYKKKSVLKAGNYEHCPLMEDDMLWVRMLLSKARCTNINDYLVFARTGMEMISRRSGWEYFLKYKHGREKIYNTGYISKYDLWKTLIIQLIVVIMPSFMRRIVYTKILR